MAAMRSMSSVASACITSMASSAVTVPTRRSFSSTTGSSTWSRRSISSTARSWSSSGCSRAAGWAMNWSRRFPVGAMIRSRTVTRPSRQKRSSTT